jgi:hypothetical protein
MSSGRSPRPSGMQTRVIRYRTKPESTDENEQLVAAVYAELHERRPPDMGYLTVRLPDGTFIHIHEDRTGGGTSGLTGLEAFGRFVSGVDGRCIDKPAPVEGTIVGSYGFTDR